MWRKNMIRLCFSRETKDQVGSRVDEFSVFEGCRARYSVVPNSIEYLVRGYLAMFSSYIEPKAIKGEGLGVVLVG